MLPLMTTKNMNHPNTMNKQPTFNPQKNKPNHILWVIGIMIVFTFLFVLGWFLLTKL